jgi:hypothetical protein
MAMLHASISGRRNVRSANILPSPTLGRRVTLTMRASSRSTSAAG